MKTIVLLGDTYKVKKSFDSCYCILPTGINVFQINGDGKKTVSFGQEVFNVVMIETGSVIFTLQSESKTRYVSTLSGYFSSSQASLSIIKEAEILEKQIDKLLSERNLLLKKIPTISNKTFKLP